MHREQLFMETTPLCCMMPFTLRLSNHFTTLQGRAQHAKHAELR